MGETREAQQFGAVFLGEGTTRQLFVAAEYIAPDTRGRNTLALYLAAERTSLQQQVIWAGQFCFGMKHALRSGMKAHRDIKPDNLMIDGTKTLKITDFGLATLLDTEISGDADLRREIGDLGKRVTNVSRTGEDRRRECHGVPQASASSAFSWQCRCPSAIARRALEWSPCLDPGENHASFSPMARKSLTLERESPTPQPAVKTGADALEFYRRKTVWLSPKNLAGIERQLREKRRSPRS